MVSPTFVLTAYKIKDEVTRRNVNFRQTKLRYFVVVLACLVVFGSEYCFDTPSALQIQIQQNYDHKYAPDKMTEPQFNLLYSLYSLPNIIVPLLGGMLIDTKGPRIALIISTIFCVIGQAIYGYGGFANIWLVMLIGRFVFGLGGQVLHAAQNTIISRWFKATQLSVVLGICISFPKMGSSLNAIVSTMIGQYYEHHQKQGEYLNVGMPLLIGLGLMVFSLMLAFVLAYYDKKTEKMEKTKHQSQILSQGKSVYKAKSMLTGNQKSQVEVRFLERSQVGDDDKQNVQQGASHLDCNAIKKLPITYWLLLIIAMLAQSLFIPFLDNGNKYFLMVFKSIENTQQAGIYLALPYVVSSFMVVPLGLLADKIRKRGYLLIASTGFIYLTYAFMMYIETDASLRDSKIIPWIPVGLLGVCVAIFCAIVVPTVPMICPPQLLGTGFGMMEMLENLALAALPLISGTIRETQKDEEHESLGELKGFHMQTMFFYLIACLCVACAIFLQAADRFRGNKLSKKNFRLTYINKIMRE